MLSNPLLYRIAILSNVQYHFKVPQSPMLENFLFLGDGVT